MKVWLTRDDKTSRYIYFWPEGKKPYWDAEYAKGWESVDYCPMSIGPLFAEYLDSLPPCLLEGGRKAIVLVEMTVNEIKEAQ